MPKPPLLHPDSIFHAMPVVRPINCYYCPHPIIPEENEEYILTAQKDKAALNFHPQCLDQFVWTGLHFYAGYVRDRAKPELLN